MPVCNGLLFDWSSWIKEQDRSKADAMQTALEALSPAGDDTLTVGPVQRLSRRDSRDIPTIQTSWAGAVPILHAAAGVRRVCALAYVLTWAWQEHRLVADHMGEPATRSVLMLFDEVESHLHPRWQRTTLASLRDLGGVLLGDVGLQLMVTTHSPLVMASAEPWFDAEQDAWFDLDLEGDPPLVTLRERRYRPLGSAGSWLTSEAFDLATDRGNVEAETAVVRARKLLRDPHPRLAQVMAVDEALRAALPDVDEFWVRWNAFVERNGGSP
ncbi:MAG: AAA family ATPase [Gammaproteobacteria bacterium]|nr:AAA family ATPase [Gammaproteobacteria bacterium]